MSRTNPLPTFAMEIAGGLVLFASIYLAAYGLEIVTSFLATTEISTFVTIILQWTVSLIFVANVVMLGAFVIGAIINLRNNLQGKNGGSRG